MEKMKRRNSEPNLSATKSILSRSLNLSPVAESLFMSTWTLISYSVIHYSLTQTLSIRILFISQLIMNILCVISFAVISEPWARISYAVLWFITSENIGGPTTAWIQPITIQFFCDQISYRESGEPSGFLSIGIIWLLLTISDWLWNHSKFFICAFQIGYVSLFSRGIRFQCEAWHLWRYSKMEEAEMLLMNWKKQERQQEPSSLIKIMETETIRNLVLMKNMIVLID